MNKKEKRLSVSFAFSFLRWVCPDHLYEEIEGDLIQKYNREIKTCGQRRATRRLVWNAIRFCRPGIVVRNEFRIRLNQWDMYGHFLKVFFRTSLTHKSYALINILGLTFGLTAFLLISIYVWHERSYDNFHQKKNQLYRVRHDRFTNGVNNRQWTAGPMGIGADLKNNFPEVKRYVLLNKGVSGNTILANGDVFFKEEKLFFATSEFFTLFSFPLLNGVDSLVLRDPFTMVVSQSLAKRYFGDEDPVGKTLKRNGKEEYVITSVFKDVPENTHLKFDALFSFESLLRILGPEETNELMTNWGWEGTNTYIELDSMAQADALQAKLPAFVNTRMGAKLRERNEWMAFTLQPITAIHLRSDAPDELEPGGNEKSNQYLMLIAVFILLMAWINYVNLATARAMERAREVGIRKVLGSNRAALIRQFIFESFAIKLIALIMTVALLFLILPFFSTMINQTISFSIFREVTFWFYIVVIFFAGVIGAGLYPAFVLSGFEPIRILKGRFKASVTGNYLRKGLVTIQFISSLVLLIGVFAVHKQLQFMRNSATGVDMEQVLVVHGPAVIDSSYRSQFHSFQQSLLHYPDIKKVSVSTDVPGHHVTTSSGNVRLVGQDVSMGNTYQAIMTDEDFVTTYGLTIIEGEDFSGNISAEWKSVLVNETALKLLGFTDPKEVIGRKMNLWGDTPEVIGVIKDYHQTYLKNKVSPLVLVYDKGISDYFSIKIKTKKPINVLVKQAESVYKTIFPGNPFSYYFLDDHYNQQYQADQLFARVFGWFTVMAIFIACLGLFGLSSLLVVQRTREIGIRKVLGATARQIAFLVSKEFVIIVLLANVVAWPVAYFVMEDWLSDFANHIQLGIVVFLIPGISALLIAVITVSSQAVKAAWINPVDNLRSE